MYLDEFKKLGRLAFPFALAQLAQNTMSLVDTMMVGKLGEQELASMAIGSTTFFFVLMMLSGVIYAVNPLVSNAKGAGEDDKIARVVRQGFWIAAMGFVPAMILFWNIEVPLRALGQKEEVVQACGGYIRAISFGLLPALISVSFRGFLEGISDAKPIVVIGIIAVGLNVFLNDALMFGRYGLPPLGLVGTGVASSIVYSLIGLITGAYIFYCRSEYRIFEAIHRPDGETLAELFRVGIPICLTVAFEGCLFMFATFLMGLFPGSEQLAAHQIALQTASFTFMIPLGVALATCVRVGNCAGAEDHEGARRAGRVGILTSVVAVIPGMIAFAFFGRQVIGLYIDLSLPEHKTVLNYGIVFLQIAAMFQITDALQVCASNALRALKQTRVAMNLALVSYWLIGAPICVLLGFAAGFEGQGIWIGLTASLAAAAVMLSVRFELEFRKP